MAQGEMKKTHNAQRPTLNAQFRLREKLSVGRWTLDVGRLLPL
jgi:hypothetical protein